MIMKTEVEIELTPKVMAERFWELDAEKQAEFFHELGQNIAGDTFHAQVQWFSLEEYLRKDHLAKDTFMDMAAPMFWQTLKYMEKV